MKRPKKPGGASPGYGSPGYGSPTGPGAGGGRSGRPDKDAQSSGDFGGRPLRGNRRGPGAGPRRHQAGGGFGGEYDEGPQLYGGHDEHDEERY